MIVTDREPVVYMALQVLGYRVIVTTSAEAFLVKDPNVRRKAAALRMNIFAPGAEALLRLLSLVIIVAIALSFAGV